MPKVIEAVLHPRSGNNTFVSHLEPVELEFVFAGRFCPAGTENGGALLVVRPKEIKSENMIAHVLGMPLPQDRGKFE